MAIFMFIQQLKKKKYWPKAVRTAARNLVPGLRPQARSTHWGVSAQNSLVCLTIWPSSLSGTAFSQSSLLALKPQPSAQEPGVQGRHCTFCTRP